MTEINWTKARKCPNHATCVEVAEQDGEVLVRDGKNPDGPVLSFTPGEWAVFAAGMRGTDFDHIGAGEQS
jgi:hypothetical protein